MKRVLVYIAVLLLLGSGVSRAAGGSAVTLTIDDVTIRCTITKISVAVQLDTEDARRTAISAPEKIVDGIFAEYEALFGTLPACDKKGLAKEIKGHAQLYNHFSAIYRSALKTAGRQKQNHAEYIAQVQDYMKRAIVADCSLTDTPDADSIYVGIYSDFISMLRK